MATLALEPECAEAHATATRSTNRHFPLSRALLDPPGRGEAPRSVADMTPGLDAIL